MEHFEKLKKEFIEKYESTLAIEGNEICKEIDSLFPDDIFLSIEKASAYCDHCRCNVDTKLQDKCEKYIKLQDKCEKCIKQLKYYDKLKFLDTIYYVKEV